jgi:hypothetical protein
VKRTAGVVVAWVAVAACKSRNCCSPPPLNKAVVWGQVSVDTGGAAARAAMTALATPLGIRCVQDSMYSWGNADSAGRYRLTVFGAEVGDSGCVFVGARFPAQGSSARDTVLGPFKLHFQVDPPFDSVHVNIVVGH